MPKQEVSTQIELSPPQELQNTSQSLTPLEILNLAVQKGADINTIERLVALQERMLSKQAEAEFNSALNHVQDKIKHVAPDLLNKQTSSKYASYPALDKVVRPLYIAEGFSLSFDTGDAPQPEMVRVLCYCSHASGHTRMYKVDMPADGKGAKGGDVMTRTHATGAAMSYGMRYLLKYIFNVAIGEDDRDGNATNGELQEKLEWIANASSKEELTRLYKEAYQQFEEIPSAIKAIVAARKAKAEEF